MTTEKCYSSDQENYNYDDLEDLIDTIQPEVGQLYWEAEKVNCVSTDPINSHTVDSLLENFDERMYEELGEVYDNDCSDATAEAKAALKELLEDWAKKYINLNRYWRVTGTPVEKKFTAEDLA